MLPCETRGKEIYGSSYSSGVDASVLSSGHDETLTGQEEAVSESSVFGANVTLDDVGDNLQLIWLEL